jgi:hypothetical protein
MYLSSMKSRIRKAMSKESAISLLGKKKKPKQVTDYSEDERLIAFRET